MNKSNFEFDAPIYADLTNPQSDDDGMDYFLGNSDCVTNSQPSVNLGTLCNDDSKGDAVSKSSKYPITDTNTYAEETPNKQQSLVRQSPRLLQQVTQVEGGAKCIDQPKGIRQSPRLAANVKNLVSMHEAKLLMGGARRRSLSEGSGAIPNKINKITKTNIGRMRSFRSSNIVNNVVTHNLESNSVEKSSMSRNIKSKLYHLTTSAKLRNKISNEIDDQPVKDFARMLRSSRNEVMNKNKEATKGPTKVKAFHLHEPKKPKEAAQPFVSFAEAALKFVSKTPQRFYSKRSNTSEQTKMKKNCNEQLKVTMPKTPQLTARLRSRPTSHFPTREEIEEKEMVEAKKHVFKAQPVDKKIFEGPKIEIKGKSKLATVPQPFNITDSKWKGDEHVLLQPSKLLRVNCELDQTASSIGHDGVLTKWNKRTTDVKPFSFDARDMELLQKKKEKIQKLIEDEKKKAEFHAQLMPIFEEGVKGLPEKKVNSPTKLQPFHLRSDIRGMTKQQQLKRELEEIERLQAEQRKFKAQSDTVLHKQPFIPEKSNKPLTDVSGFVLNTEKRFEERIAFDQYIKQKEHEIELKKREAEEERKAEEEVEIAQLRKNAVHKAQPIRHYKNVNIVPGSLPATQPISPEFLTEQRIKTRSSAKSNLNTTATIGGSATSL